MAFLLLLVKEEFQANGNTGEFLSMVVCLWSQITQLYLTIPLFLFLSNILGFHCHAIDKKNRNRSMNEVRELTCH